MIWVEDQDVEEKGFNTFRLHENVGRETVQYFEWLPIARSSLIEEAFYERER